MLPVTVMFATWLFQMVPPCLTAPQGPAAAIYHLQRGSETGVCLTGTVIGMRGCGHPVCTLVMMPGLTW